MKNYASIINHAEDYIEENLSNDILLEDVADSVFLSKYHFHRIFSNTVNETFHQFVTRIKMERSAIYLAFHPDINITDIAIKYGYNSPSVFSKAFKNHFGISPVNFRKKQDKTCIKKSIPL